jgi:hypothetical protein
LDLAGPPHGLKLIGMIAEKSRAFVEAATTLASGGTAHTVVAGYRKHVRANARRLRRWS